MSPHGCGVDGIEPEISSLLVKLLLFGIAQYGASCVICCVVSSFSHTFQLVKL